MIQFAVDNGITVGTIVLVVVGGIDVNVLVDLAASVLAIAVSPGVSDCDGAHPAKDNTIAATMLAVIRIIKTFTNHPGFEFRIFISRLVFISSPFPVILLYGKVGHRMRPK